MIGKYGGHSMFGSLKSVLVRRPQKAFGTADPREWHYAGKPDLEKAQAEHDDLVKLLAENGAQIHKHDRPLPGHADSIYVFDPVLITNRGLISLRMGKELRRGEEGPLAQRLIQLGVPLLGEIRPPGLVESGDLLWLDAKTLAAGIGFRTNQDGVRQLERILNPLGVRVLPLHLPFGEGPEACLHLLSLISMLDANLAIVHLPLLPVPLWEELRRRGVTLIETTSEEFKAMGPNVLALGPRRCVLLESNSSVRRKLERAGCEVFGYRGQEISLKAEGGPTCLTLPIWRDAE